MFDRNEIATTTYRRANASQAAVSKPRVVRAAKAFPRARTPSPDLRPVERYARRSGAVNPAAAAMEIFQRVSMPERQTVVDVMRRDIRAGLPAVLGA